MTFRLLTYRLLLAMTPLVLLAGCADDLSVPDSGQDTPAEEPGVWVSLQLSTPRATRADDADDSEEVKVTGPKPGQWGDGSQTGEWNECKIENLALLLFSENVSDDEDRHGLDAEDYDANIYFKDYFTGERLDSLLTPPWQDPMPGSDPYDNVSHYKFKITGERMPKKGDFAIVIANYGEGIKQKLTGDLTLSDITGLTKDDGSWIDNDKEIAEDNTDFLMANAYNVQKPGVNLIEEPTVSGGYAAGDFHNPFKTTVYLQRAAARIDLLYKSADVKDSGDDAKLIEYECTTKDGKVTATVEVTDIKPINVRKGKTYVLKHLENGICADEKLGSDGIPSNYVKDFSFEDKEGLTSYRDTEFISINKILSAGNMSIYNEKELGMDAAVITYAEENTMRKEQEDPASYATGLLLKANYRPKKVYADANLTEDTDYAGGKDLWRYMPTSVNSALTDAEAKYFSNEEAAITYRDNNSDEAGYITPFYGGVCYYNVWIRHANLEGHSYDRPIKMEFGIVRNNIYRLSFSFSGPGTTEPEIREPYNVRPHIFVRPWNPRPQDEIIL